MVDPMRAFVCGHPIAHSRSPLIHGYWLDKYGVEGSYEKIDVAPENIAEFLNDLKANGWVGGNVTIPHKEVTFEHVSKLDEAANAIGAVNTLWFEDNVLCGGNTDAYGFTANLDSQLDNWRSAETAVVFGAGGASRAVVFALIQAGLKKIQIVNRTLDRAEKMVESFGNRVSAVSWEAAEALVASADILVNTTSLGMKGQPDFPLDLRNARVDAVASDIVYVPLDTPFLTMMNNRGLQTSDGLGMLLHQAVPGFEKWFGVRPEVDATLRKLILDDLNPAKGL